MHLLKLSVIFCTDSRPVSFRSIQKIRLVCLKVGSSSR